MESIFSDSVCFLGGGILVDVMVKIQGSGQYRYTETRGRNFLIFIFLTSEISSGDELSCVTGAAAMTQL